MSLERVNKGKAAEEAAVKFLTGQGYQIILRNYRSKAGEIDIIAKEKDVLCFIEVKARTSDMCGEPQEAVTRLKQNRIGKVAVQFLKDNNLFDRSARFDVVSVDICENNEFNIDIIKDAFELSSRYTF